MTRQSLTQQELKQDKSRNKIIDTTLENDKSVYDNIVPKQVLELHKENLRGRPTKYKPEMCDKVIEYMAQGMSKKEVAYLLGIKYETLVDWEHKNSEFSNAIKRGELGSEFWWSAIGRFNLMNKNFNATLWMMNMSNRFGWTRRIDGDLKIDTHKTIHYTQTLEVKIDTNERASEVARILVESGAIQPTTEDTIGAQTH